MTYPERDMHNAWDAAYAAAQERYGPLDLPRSEAEARVREHLVRRLEPLALAPLEATLDDLLLRSVGADLVLAAAVESGLAGAAARVRERVAPALRELARKRGVVTGLAERYVAQVIEQALETAPSGLTRTRLAAYDGSATLPAWLALGLEERIQEDARQPAPGEPPPPPAPPVVAQEHPSANLLAGLAEGRLLAAESEAVVTHAAACARCGSLLRGLALAGLRPAEAAELANDPSADRPISRGLGTTTQPARRLGGVLLAVLVTLGIVMLAAAQGGRGLFQRLGLGQDSEQEVFETTARLQRTEPGMFGEFEPYTRQELESGTARPSLEAEGPRPVHPRERVLSGTPTFLWKSVPEATHYTLAILDDAGARLWTGAIAGTSQPWPAELPALLPSATAEWEIAVAGGTERPLRMRFSVAPERDGVHWERRVKRLGELVPEQGVRAILTAQIALRRGHLWEAWEAVRAHTRRVPNDGYGGALEGYLRRLHGFHD